MWPKISKDGKWFLRASAIDVLTVGSYNVTVTGTDALGNAGVDATSNELSIVSALPTTFRVSDLIVGASTLFIDFNQPLDVSALNIVDGADASVDAPDVSLIGANVGRVGGSLLWDNAAKRLTFVKTGGVLLPEPYTLTLASRADGIKLANGELLVVIRTILLVATMCEPYGVAIILAVISIADFARGATSAQGQTVNVSYNNGLGGIPISISNGADVLAIDLDVVFDRQILDISSAFVNVLPSGWSTSVNIVSDGRVRLTMHGTTPLPAGSREIARVLASVPANVPYGACAIAADRKPGLIHQRGWCHADGCANRSWSAQSPSLLEIPMLMGSTQRKMPVGSPPCVPVSSPASMPILVRSGFNC